MNKFSTKSRLGYFAAILLQTIFCSLLLIGNSYAQEFQFSPDIKTKKFRAYLNTTYVTNTANNDLNVSHEQWDYMVQYPTIWPSKYTFPVVSDIISVGIDHDAGIVANAPYKYKIVLSVKGYTDPATFVTVPLSETTFIIENNNDSLVAYPDLDTRKLNYKFHRMEIQIQSISEYDLNNPTAVPVDINFSNAVKNFFIESSVIVQRYDKIESLGFFVASQPNVTNQELNVSWAYVPYSPTPDCSSLSASLKPLKYELEWTYVDDYKFNYDNGSYSYKNTESSFSVAYDFRNNATRIQTYGNSFNIPIIYEHGTIVFRVRSIRPDPANLSKLIYSAWSITSDQGIFTQSSFSPYYLCKSRCIYQILTPHENDKFDWQYSINFAEEGKYKHVLNYFDGAGHNRQTQTKINSDNQYIIAAEHIYDYEGRPSIQTLPIPVISQNLKYKNNLSYKAGSSPLSPYTAADFDKGCISEPIPSFDGVSLASTYYSPSNTDKLGMQKFVPDAEGYPFIQTIYSPDNTNKVLVQGGAGKNFQLSTNHVTSNSYVRADQQELNKLFGTQVGRSEYYPKVITKDPNGQMSYSIFNQSGKVVATALVGSAPSNSTTPIVELDGGIPAPATVSSDILANLTQSTGDNMRSANYAFFPDAGGTISMSYNNGTIPPYDAGCINASDRYINVKGIYTTKIADECGNVMYTEPIQSVGETSFQSGNSPKTITTTSGAGFNPPQPAKYTLIKELYFPDSEIRDRANIFTNNNSGINKCYFYQDHFIRKSVDASSVPCNKMVEPSSHCGLLKRKMMDDLYPGAKYGKYTKNEDGTFSEGLANSIFTMVDQNGAEFAPPPLMPGGGGGPVSPTSPCHYTKRCSYENGGGPVNQNGNSLYITEEVVYCNAGDVPVPAPGVIFTSNNMYCYNQPVVCDDYKYRYQWCLTLPNISWWDGTIGTLGPAGGFSPDIFIASFNDAIAEALLPFHPEYCKLLFCDDAYPAFLSKIKTYKEAQILGVTGLSAIIAGDPLNVPGAFNQQDLSKLMTPPPPVSAANFNASSFGRNLDIQALESAYCGCESPEALAYCRKFEYKNQIANLQFSTADTQLSNTYIRNLISIYLANRTIRMQKRLESANNDCGACDATFRIQTILPPKVFDDIFGADGLADGSGDLSTLPNGDADFTNQSSAFIDAYNDAMNGTTPVVPGSAITADNNSQYADCDAEVQSFYNALKYWVGLNNGVGTAALLNNLKNQTGCTSISSTPPFNKLTPAGIKTLLGNDLNEYWNPYLAAYNIFDNTQNKPEIDFVSKNPKFYIGLENFLSHTDVKNALSTANTGTGYSFNLDPNNKFENELATTLNLTSSGNITAKAYTKTVTDAEMLSTFNGNNSRNYIALVLTNTGTPTFFDTLYFAKRVQSPCNPPLNNYNVGVVSVPIANFSFSNVQSALDEPSYVGASGGIVRDNLVFAKLSGTANSSASCDNYVIWGFKTAMLNPIDPDGLDKCINCVQIKNAVEQYFTDASTWGLPTFVSHPNFKISITNYLNYKLGKKHGYYDYERLMKGCALSNFLPFKKTPGQFYFNLSEPDAATLIAGVNTYVNNLNTDPSENVSIDYFSYKKGSNINLWLDLNSMPYSKRVNVYNYISGNYPASLSNGFDPDLYIEILVPSTTIPNWAFFADYEANGVSVPDPINVTLKDANGSYSIAYKKYTIYGASGASEEYIANLIDTVKSNLSYIAGVTFLESREVMRTKDYYYPPVSGNTINDKKAYLNYAYGLSSSLNPSDVAGSLSPSVLKGSNGIAPFTTMDLVSYNNPWCVGAKTNLNYSPAPTISNPGWARLTNILTNVKNQLTGNKLFPSVNVTGASTTNLGTGGPTPTSLSLKIIKMSNGSAWYRFFDDYNKLYNVYLLPAENMLPWAWQNGVSPDDGGQSGYSMVPNSLVALPDTFIHRFKVDMQRQFNIVGLGTVTHTVTCYGYTDILLGESNVLKDVVLADAEPQCLDTLPCERIVTLTAIQQGKAMYTQYIDSIKESHVLAMRKWFPEQTKDILILSTKKQQYQYTLYNYDLAGNLTSTIPPMGIDNVWPNSSTVNNVDYFRNSGFTNSATYPDYKKKSEYFYNSLNQLIKQKTPDAGETNFFYDKSGKLAFSQNAKQFPQGRFSYTLYDDQDRIKETGVVYLPWQTYAVVSPEISGPEIVFPTSPAESPSEIATNANTRTSAEIADIITAKPREDVVATFYDQPLLELNTYTNAGLSAQENMRKRVSSIVFVPQLAINNSAASYYSYGTHFSYDALGNVKTLVQDNPYLDYLGQRFKRIDYDYDLLSGKVNMVSYNRGRADQFYQKYKYDADNRITKVESSNDGLYWDWDASYTYYKHGPLAQMKVGDLRVQSVQYAYTIQGWLKAINGDVLDSTVDMGQDGMLQAGETIPAYPRDAMAHALDYHQGDYIPIGNQQVTNAGNANLLANAGNPDAMTKSLYNGNIARQTTAISNLDNLQRTYTYDQLNRIKATQYAMVDNISKAVVNMANNAFANTYKYDKDGNILALTRRDGAGTTIDNLEYNYTLGTTVNVSNATIDNNKLRNVTDNGTTDGLPTGQGTENYRYDEIGNLIGDVQGNIQNILWNAYGKVTDIQIDGDNKKIHYDYDGMGNRIRKDVLTKVGDDYMRSSDLYVRDASGNILAVYKGKGQIDNNYSIAWANEQIINYHGDWLTEEGYGLAPFLVREFGYNGQFTMGLLQMAQQLDLSWCEDQTNSLSLSGYLQTSHGLFNQVVTENIDNYFDELIKDESAHTSTIIAGSFADNNAVQRYFSPIFSDLINIDTKDQSQQERVTNTFLLMCNKAPLFSKSLLEDIGVVYAGNDAQDANNLLKSIVDGKYETIMEFFHTPSENSEQQDQLRDFAVAVIVEQSIIDSKWLQAFPDSRRSVIEALEATTERESASIFLGDWLAENNSEWLKNNTSLDDRLNIVFQKDRVEFLVNYLNQFGVESINAAITNIPQMTVSDYARRVWDGVFHGTLNPTYTPPNVVTPDPSNLLADRLDLGEHHFYGSSRLGIKTYNEGQYRVTYTPGSGSPGSLTENTLGEYTPWYNDSYATWIMKDKTDPFTGSTFNLVTLGMENIRNLGMKQYELTDHLGNVLATVLDKKTGFGNVNGFYKVFHANLASVTDYYPGGMEMQERVRAYYSSRFGYQSSEKDYDVNQNIYTTLYRELDTRINRWWAVDPRSNENPSTSSYVLNGNNPILLIDPKGDKEYQNRLSYFFATGKSSLGSGDWLGRDRLNNTKTWRNANAYNLNQKNGFKEYVNIEQRAAFYNWFQETSSAKGFETRWAGAASSVAYAINELANPTICGINVTGLARTYGYTSDAAIDFANTGNRMIFEDVFPKLKGLIHGPALVGKDAKAWDALALAQEQTLIQPLYDNTKDYGGIAAAGSQTLAFAKPIAWLKGIDIKPFPVNGIMGVANQRWAYGMSAMGYKVTPAQMPSAGASYINGTMYSKFRGPVNFNYWTK